MEKYFHYLRSAKVIWLFLVLLCIPAILPFFRSHFFPTQDYIYIARLEQMVTALMDGHFPVRWARDLRYGEPLFNFYAPLPYYLGSVIKIVTDFLGLGISYIWTTKLLFVLAIFFSAVSMYFFTKEFFGKLGGFVAAAFYVYAPYHSVDIFVRGALSETWALVFFPLIFLTSFKLAEQGTKKNLILFILSLSGLFLTHNIMTLLFAPFVAIWMLVVSRFSFKKVLIQIGGLIWAIIISAFYLLPAFLEKNLVQPTALLNSYYDYRAHFVSIDQLIVPFWGYGASVWGYEDGLSFQLGILHWFVVLFAGLILFFATLLLYKKKLSIPLPLSFVFPKELVSRLFFLCVLMFLFFVSLLMTHNQSTPIWRTFTLLQFSQFPWRFLGISIFFASFFAGVPFYFAKKLSLSLAIVLVGLVVLINVSYFRPDFYEDYRDDDFISLKELKNETKLPKDYVPADVKEFDRPIVLEPNFTENSGMIDQYQLKTGQVNFRVFSETGGTVEVPVYYFAGWKAFENGSEIKIADPDKFGLIRIPVSAGTNAIQLVFTNTFIRMIANTLSFIAIGVLILYGLVKRLKFSKQI